MIRTVLLVTVLCLARSQAEVFSRCIHNQGSLPRHVDIEGCRYPPCEFPQEQDAVVNVIFNAPRDMDSMLTRVIGYYYVISGIAIPIPWPLEDQATTCNYLLNTQCPVQQHQLIKSQLTIYIEPVFPAAISIPVEFVILDETNNTPAVCFRVDILISEPVPQANGEVNVIETA